MQENSIVPYKQTYVIATVKGDVFESAMRLYNSGMMVDTVMFRTRSVMGWCTEQGRDAIAALPCVASVESSSEWL